MVRRRNSPRRDCTYAGVAPSVAPSVAFRQADRSLTLLPDFRFPDMTPKSAGASSAGSNPTMNKGRQLPAGKNHRCHPRSQHIAEHAQPVCMIPTAFARCSAGHVSATSTAPVDHSAPRPMPISARQKQQ